MPRPLLGRALPAVGISLALVAASATVAHAAAPAQALVGAPAATVTTSLGSSVRAGLASASLPVPTAVSAPSAKKLTPKQKAAAKKAAAKKAAAKKAAAKKAAAKKAAAKKAAAKKAASSAASKASPKRAPGAPKTTTSSAQLAWPKAAKASGYEYQLVKGTAFGQAPTRATSSTTPTQAGLSQNTTHSARYRVLVKAEGATYRSAWSPAVRLSTRAATPGTFSVASAPARDAATIRWNAAKNAQSYTLTVSDDRAMKLNVRTVKGIKGTTASVALNSPDGSRRYARVTAHNGSTQRVSPLVTVRPAAPAAASGESVSFATMNVMCAWCTVPATAGPSRATAWDARWPELARQITAQSPDVLMLQEASNRPMGDGTTAMQPLASALTGAGYGFDRELDAYKAGTANRVWFKEAKFARVDSGRIPLSTERGLRTAEWVRLRSRSTGSQFLAVSFHSSSGDPVTGAVSRTQDAVLMDAALAKLNPEGIPVLLGGDFGAEPNAHASSGPFRTLMARGYTDAQSAPARSGDLFGTYNGLRDVNIQHDGRLDFLLTKNTGGPLSYANVISVRADGFTTSRYGSDHNLVIATTRLR